MCLWPLRTEPQLLGLLFYPANGGWKFTRSNRMWMKLYLGFSMNFDYLKILIAVPLTGVTSAGCERLWCRVWDLRDGGLTFLHRCKLKDTMSCRDKHEFTAAVVSFFPVVAAVVSCLRHKYLLLQSLPCEVHLFFYDLFQKNICIFVSAHVHVCLCVCVCVICVSVCLSVCLTDWLDCLPACLSVSVRVVVGKHYKVQ